MTEWSDQYDQLTSFQFWNDNLKTDSPKKTETAHGFEILEHFEYSIKSWLRFLTPQKELY